MTAPTEPSVEASVLTSEDFAEFGGLRFPTEEWHQIDAAVNRILARHIADHERAVRQARAEVLRECARDAANAFTEDSARGYAIWLWCTEYAEALARAAQPEEQANCAPSPACRCHCHRSGGMTVSHVAPCCSPQPEDPSALRTGEA